VWKLGTARFDFQGCQASPGAGSGREIKSVPDDLFAWIKGLFCKGGAKANPRASQRRPFTAGSALMSQLKKTAKANKEFFNADYGIFFSTSGKALLERINPSRQYNYIWTTE
jgi:hypothetical protein